MSDAPPRRTWTAGPPLVPLGIALVVAGVVLLAGQALDIDLGRIGWPLFVITPGVVLLAVGLSWPADARVSIVGSVVTVVGLILLYQEAADHYESWSYAWALAGPFAVGAGRILHGLLHRRPDVVRAGLAFAVSGLVVFVVGFFFFEGLIGIGGEPLAIPPWVAPVALIVIGLGAIAWSLARRRGEQRRAT